jgi:hypothetical protein
MPPPERRRGRGVLIAAIAGLAVLLVALGAGGFVLLNRGSDLASPQDTLWSQYFFPAREGYECTYESTFDLGFISTTATQTQTVTDVETTDEGRKITIHSATTTKIGGALPTDLPSGVPDLSDIPATPVELDLSYVIGGDGTVHAPPASLSTAGLQVETDNAFVIPSIEDLRDGEATDSTVTVSVDLGDLSADVGRITMRFDVHIEAADPETITTKAGQYTDVVGVTLSFDDLEFVGGIPGLDEQMPGFEDMIGSFLPETTTWYARGVGVVRTDVKAFATEMSAELTGCRG